MHSQSESHVRKVLQVGEDPKKAINEFSDQFLKAFLSQLKTSHGEKSISINRFYQEYIADKEHLHMNATKWPSLTEFAKYLGREGICRVEEEEKGLTIAWIDNSPEALRRQEALRKKEMQDKGEEELEQMMIKEQIKRARQAAGAADEEEDEEAHELKRGEGEKITLSFGAKPTSKPDASAKPLSDDASAAGPSTTSPPDATSKAPEKPADKPAGLSLKMSAKPQTKNVFAQAKKNALAGGVKKGSAFQQPKKMSEAERIMKEEMEKKRPREPSGGGPFKKQKLGFGG